MDSRERQELLIELEEKGMTPDQIDRIMDAMEQKEDQDDKKLDDKIHSMSRKPFEDDPTKPEFYKSGEEIQPFKPVFLLESDQSFSLNKRQYKVPKLCLNDIMRLMAKAPHWANYLGYNVPDMLIDPVTKRYRIPQTITKVLTRALGDYDIKKNMPTDFSLSVCEELAMLMGIDVNHLLSCPPDEVLTATKKIVEVNQVFFTQLWDASGPIKEASSLIGGLISKYINDMKKTLSVEKEKEETLDQELSQPLETHTETETETLSSGGADSGG